MKFSEAKQGRVFVIRLEDGDVMHAELERFAREHAIKAAALLAVGGADRGSRLVVGPQEAAARPVQPLEHTLADVHEFAGLGTIFPDETGEPVLHMHAACGREAAAVAGCVRAGVKTWQVMEVVLMELADCRATRAPDPATGFKLLEP